MTRDDMVRELRAGGYDGPVSYGKERLAALLRGRQGGAAGGDGPIAAGAGEGRLSPVSGPARLTEWAGLKAGDRVKIAEKADGRAPRNAWWLFGYYCDDGKGGFVHVFGDSPRTSGRTRDVLPEKIQNKKGKFVMPQPEGEADA